MSDYFGPISPRNWEKALRAQLAKGIQPQGVNPPKPLERGQLKQAVGNVVRLNRLKQAQSMSPGAVAVPRPLAVSDDKRKGPFTPPPRQGASIGRLPLPRVPGSGVPRLLPQFTPKANTKVVPASLSPLNVPGGNLGPALRQFQTEPKRQMANPINFVASSPAGRVVRRSPGFYASLAGLGEVQIVDLTQGGAVMTVPLNGLGFTPTVYITEAEPVNGLFGLGAAPRSKGPRVSTFNLPSPKDLKQAKRARGSLRGFAGLDGVAEVRAQVKQNFDLIIDMAAVPALEAILKQVYTLVIGKMKDKKAGVDAVFNIIGFNGTTGKLDPQGPGVRFIKQKFTDAAFNNLNEATKVFEQVNKALDVVGFPLVNFPRNLKKEVIKQIWSENFGGEAALEPDPTLLDRMDKELATVQSVDTLVNRITTNESYAPKASQPAAPPSQTNPTGDSAAPLPQVATTSFSNTTIYAIAGGVVLLGGIAFWALRRR